MVYMRRIVRHGRTIRNHHLSGGWQVRDGHAGLGVLDGQYTIGAQGQLTDHRGCVVVVAHDLQYEKSGVVHMADGVLLLYFGMTVNPGGCRTWVADHWSCKKYGNAV